MEMHQIRYFLTLSQTLNFTKAAEQCHVAQPSLTRAIKKLEDELGGELFRRERTHTHLSELGRLMLPVLRKSYDHAVQAKEIAASFHSAERAPLSIAISATIDLAIVSPFLAELSRALPGLEIQISRGSADEVSELLREGRVEIAVAGPLEDSWDRLESWLLFSECLNVIVSNQHPFAESREVTLKQLASETFLSRQYCECRKLISALLSEHGITENNSHGIPSDSDLISLVSAGLGIAFAPESAPHHRAVRSIRIADTDITRDITLYSVAGRRRTPASNALIKLLRAADWEYRMQAGPGNSLQ